MNRAIGTDERDVATAIAEAMHQAPPGVISAYLFGSVAVGRSHAESDV
jgi:hypothetical protein